MRTANWIQSKSLAILAVGWRRARTVQCLLGIALTGIFFGQAAVADEAKIAAKLSRSFTSVAFSPDGRLALSGSMDKTLKLWNLTTAAEVRSFSGHTGPVWTVAFSPDGRKALSGSSDNTVKLWDVTTGAELRSFSGHAYGVWSVAF